MYHCFILNSLLINGASLKLLVLINLIPAPYIVQEFRPCTLSITNFVLACPLSAANLHSDFSRLRASRLNPTRTPPPPVGQVVVLLKVFVMAMQNNPSLRSSGSIGQTVNNRVKAPILQRFISLREHCLPEGSFRSLPDSFPKTAIQPPETKTFLIKPSS